ncbi:MAG: DNA-directed RNA polymerase subunit delta [Erysipelotrichia bacterium]|nr:DNA-directed RNA polymerase subunit delta [Erysipelotrichia bacterium]
MAPKETMTDAAYNLMAKRKKEIEFARLWQEVAKTIEIPPEKLARKKAQFYSELMLDTRFASLKGNKWDLRSRRKFDEFHKEVEVSDIDDDVDEIEEDEESEGPKESDEY